LFSASCISAAFPSKNLPHPVQRQSAPSKPFPVLPSRARTANKERVARKNGPAGVILHEEADAILRVARGVHAPDRDAAQFESLLVRRSPSYALAVLAPNDL
jgi:hypothetical protein